MAINRRILLLYTILGSYFFLLGVEYAVILPTINEYLESLNADNIFLGIVLSSFSFAGLVTAPIFGYITDRTGSLTTCIVVGNLLEIGGNFMYFVGRSKYYVLGGRVLAGLGSGSISSVFGAITRTTTEEERTSSLAVLMTLRQVGLLIGPGFNVFLLILDFKIGPFEANEYTSPGLFMAILWTLHTIFFVIAYSTSRQTPGSPNEERHVQEDHEEAAQSLSCDDDPGISSGSQGEMQFSINFIQEYLREEIVVLLAASFISFFVQTGVEAAITPMTLMYFNWHGLENSIFLLVAGVVMMGSFVSIHFVSKHFSDRSLLLGGCIGIAFGYAMFFVTQIVMYFTETGTDIASWYFPVFSLTVGILLVSLSFLFVSQVSLFSKLTRTDTQAFSQGVRTVAIRIGMIVGPLWAAPMVTPGRLPIMSGIDLFLLCFLIALVIASYERLAPPPTVEDALEDDSSSETSSLLNS